MEQPDIIVGIDFGTTYTGVAWARPQQKTALSSPIQTIHNWPGTATRNEQKVHTCLVYNRDGSLSSWGPLCEDDDEIAGGKSRKEYFKIFLDKETLDDAHQSGIMEAPRSVTEAQSLVVEYLRQVYAHMKTTVQLNTGLLWEKLAVEFLFSVPTTWQTQESINAFKTAIQMAGFGTEGPRHIAKVDLTESEAAAVGTVKSSTVDFVGGDIFLCVDAGGGTTDLALMKVIEPSEPFPTLSQITQVDGIGTGAALIDRAFTAMIRKRLAMFPDLQTQLPPGCVERLVKGDKYWTMKHKFGEQVYKSAVYRLPLEGAPFTLNHQAAGIEQGKLLVTWVEVQQLFDPHIESIKEKIIEQLDWMRANCADRPVRYMILSGGLGSSRYVRDSLAHFFTTTLQHECAKGVQILQAPDPQLVVVKGLLYDRLQSLDNALSSPSALPILVTRIARASYGYMCKTRYIPAIHTGETIAQDEYDKELYALHQIKWLIKKGDTIQANSPIVSKYTLKICPGETNRQCESQIVVSDLPRELLPSSLRREGAQNLCKIVSNLEGLQESEMEKKVKGRTCWWGGTKFYVCTYEVHCIVAPADLRFELWFAGQKFSKNHEPIKIDWGKADK